MLSTLKFVRGSVGKGTFDTSLAHFRIANGTIMGYNGTLAISAPIALDIDCQPDATQLIKAIGNCSKTVTLTMTPAGKLRVASGKFKAFVNCYAEEMLTIAPSGELVPIDGVELLKALKTLERFVGNDASRPWCTGILFKGKSAFATNNITLVEYWHGVEFPCEVNIPSSAIKEILRVGEPPSSVQVDTHAVTFHYDDGRWIRTQLLSTQWPDLSRILDRDSAQAPFPEEFFDGVESIIGFKDTLNRVFFSEVGICTAKTGDDGAFYELADFPYNAIFNIDMLSLLKGVAKSIDFTSYPAPCIFMGESLRGAIVGLKDL